MTEEQARAWLLETFGSDAFRRLEQFTGLLLEEAGRQSLIARSTFSVIWSRHLADSAQLALLAPPNGRWVDVGSGGGLPGLVVAVLRDAPMILIEPRRKRVEFLAHARDEMHLSNVSVIHGTVQNARESADIISARAVSNLIDLFTWTETVVSRETLFLLPRGENAASDLEVAQHTWQGTFHVKQSLTDPNAGIVVAQEVRRR